VTEVGGFSDRHAHAVPAALVWVDAREAIIVRLTDADITIEHLESDVPAHHRATGHVRRDPTIRHGGGRDPRAGEPHRLEHLARFLDAVTARVAGVDDLLLLGPGTVREHLERRLRERSGPVGRPTPRITSEAAGRTTDPQLVVRLRHHLGQEPRRQTVGAYRWSGAVAHASSGRAVGLPERITRKPPRRR
jgi:hypothetical protein